MKPRTTDLADTNTSPPVRLSRRRWMTAATGAIGAALLPAVSGFAQQATPVAAPAATPVASRHWRRERWVGAWSAAPHTPFPAFVEFPSQLIERAHEHDIAVFGRGILPYEGAMNFSPSDRHRERVPRRQDLRD